MDLNDVRIEMRQTEIELLEVLGDRSKLKGNPHLYEVGGIKHGLVGMSYFQSMMVLSEQLHDAHGDYDSKEKRPFFIHQNPWGEKSNPINVNKKILDDYFALLPQICEPGNDILDDGKSAAVSDIYALQLLSKRVHLGEVVAHHKYDSDPGGFDSLVGMGNDSSLRDKLTHPQVEKSVLTGIWDLSEKYNLLPHKIVHFFKEAVIPKTIDVQVMYLSQNK